MDSTEFFKVYDEVPNQRSAQFADLEMKEQRDEFLFDGYAAVFDEISDMGDFTEEIRRGTFRKVLAGGLNIPLLHEHNREKLLATTKSGRLRLIEEPKGLRTLASVKRTPLSEEVKALVDSGDVTGMSFGFICGAGNSERTMRAGKPHRIIKGLKRLLDVTTTWDPAYASAEAQFRTMAFAHPAAAMSGRENLMAAYPAELEEDAADTNDAKAVWMEETEGSGVSDTPLLAARKRRLSLLTITLEGGEPEDA
jgi:Escherichia/Staphylococcus phage prohead protease